MRHAVPLCVLLLSTGLPGVASAAPLGDAPRPGLEPGSDLTCSDTTARWGAVNPSPAGTRMHGVRRFGDGSLVAVGDFGRVVTRSADGRFVLARQDASETLEDVDGSSPADVWAVGDEGVVLHGDGAAWSEVDLGTNDDLVAVSVGKSGTWIAGDHTVRRLVGQVWVDMVPPGAPKATFTDVAADDTGAWLVGGGRVWRFDGKKWKDVAFGDRLRAPSFTTVAARGPNAWIGGELDGHGVLYAYEADTWRPVPTVGLAPVAELAVTGDGDGRVPGWRVYARLSTDAVLAWTSADRTVRELAPLGVGGLDALDATVDGPVVAGAAGWIQTWADERWITQPARFPADPLDLVWGTGEDDLWVASGNQLYRRDLDVGWTGVNLHRDEPILALSGNGPGETWVVTSTMLLRYDGEGWIETKPPYERPASYASLSVTESGDAWLVAGHPLVAPPPADGAAQVVVPGWDNRLWRWHDGQWTESPVDADVGPIQKVWASSATSVWVLGTKGVARLDPSAPVGGPRWMAVPAANPSDVWGSSADDVWVARSTAAQGGTLVLAHWDGHGFTETPVADVRGDARLTGSGRRVYATDGDTVAQVGPAGVVTTYALRMDEGAFDDMVAISPSEVYFAGDLGVLARRRCTP